MGDEWADQLPHLLGTAAGTGDLTPFMLLQRQHLGEYFFAVLAFIFVERHFLLLGKEAILIDRHLCPKIAGLVLIFRNQKGKHNPSKGGFCRSDRFGFKSIGPAT